MKRRMSVIPPTLTGARCAGGDSARPVDEIPPKLSDAAQSAIVCGPSAVDIIDGMAADSAAKSAQSTGSPGNLMLATA